MSLSIQDIPKENIFAIGVIQLHSSNDGYHIANPRRPFLISRAEALNVIGYIVCHGNLEPGSVDAAVCDVDAPNPFRLAGDESRAMITPPQMPFFLISPMEGLDLIGLLVRTMRLRPSEIDAAVAAISDHARGQTNADLAKKMH